jgi:ribulose-5-phosphate 4-epimerase/fuculose-1-phosphate aldolase
MTGRIKDHRDSALELCRISRLCYDQSLVSAAGGNVSMFLPEREVVLLTARIALLIRLLDPR